MSSTKFQRTRKATITTSTAKKVAKQLGINFAKKKYNLEIFRKGMIVELEHGLRAKGASTKTNVTNDDPLLTGKIALAHLNESPYYYQALELMENLLDKYKNNSLKILKKIKNDFC